MGTNGRIGARAIALCVVSASAFAACGLAASALMVGARSERTPVSAADAAVAPRVAEAQPASKPTVTPAEAERALDRLARESRGAKPEEVARLLDLARSLPPGTRPSFDLGALLDSGDEAVALSALDYTVSRGAVALASLSIRPGSTATGLSAALRHEIEDMGGSESESAPPQSGPRSDRLARIQAAIAVLLRLGHAPASPTVAGLVDRLLLAGAGCVSDQGDLEREHGLPLYRTLKSIADDAAPNGGGRECVISGLERAVLEGKLRSKVLMFAVKLGIEGSESRLKDLLLKHGDKQMAEDYLNCGSQALDEAGRAWAAARGYLVSVGDGSHRVRWGNA